MTYVFQSIALGAASVSFAACVTLTPVRSSSRDHLSAQQSAFLSRCSMQDTAAELSRIFKGRAAPIVSEQGVSGNNLILKFRGERGLSALGIGSIYYARLETRSPNTFVQILGKPILKSQEVCSKNDWPETKCEDVMVGTQWPGFHMVTGREEADAISGALIDLKEHCGQGPEGANRAG